MSFFSVTVRSLKDELDVAHSNVQQLTIEVNVLRGSASNHERMAVTLQGIEATLKRVDAERMGSLQSQLEVTTIERDQLKTLVDNLSAQNKDIVSSLKVGSGDGRSSMMTTNDLAGRTQQGGK